MDFAVTAPEAHNFFTSFLLAHCGGGQDKPGYLGPSAERPGCFFLSAEFFSAGGRLLSLLSESILLPQEFLGCFTSAKNE
jgi:hypothetical protein